MPLTYNRYGKGRVRTLRLVREGSRHAVSELDLKVMLEGGFDRAFTDADNRSVVATDTIKNIVNVLAHRNPAAEPEVFVGMVADFLLERYDHIATVDVLATETRWTRLSVGGSPHDHGFVLDANNHPIAHLKKSRDAAFLESGVDGFTFMKTTESGWSDFHTDEYRTLADTGDRIVATAMVGRWAWTATPLSYEAASRRVLDTMLEVFLSTYSHGVQDSMYRMAEAALAAVPEIGRISLSLPNKHYIPMNLKAFGIEETGTAFLPTDEPHGQIEAVVSRS